MKIGTKRGNAISPKSADITLGVDDYTPLEGLAMYPNPAREFVSFKANESIEKIEIYNLNGQKIKTVNAQGLRDIRVCLPEISTEIYPVKICGTEPGRVSNTKLVKN